MTDVDTTTLDTGDEPTLQQFRRRVFEPWWLAVAAMLFLALWLWREAMVRVARANAESQQAEISRLQQQNELLTQQLERASNELSSLAAAHVQTVPMAGQSASPGASAKIFVDSKEHRAIAFFYNLPPTRKNSYHLWIVSTAGVPTDAGTFTVGRSGAASLPITTLPEGIRSFVVTTGDASSEPFLSADVTAR